MRKISLKLDDLAVESFRTAEAETAKGGTVDGHAATTLPCDVSVGTCFQSCARTNGYQYCIDPYC